MYSKETKLRVNLIAAALFGCCVLTAAPAMASDARRDGIRLILQITVDGLRYDLLQRYRERFGKGGFRYLLEAGTVYTNAHYQHANTETIVGHTTLATGAFPADHGMVGNVWYDRASGELAYNIEDADHPLLPSRDVEISGSQLDPAQQLARTRGRSPRAILAETLADRLLAWYGGKPRAFAVSGKDRSAVAMAGHGGKAFWFSTDTGDFITSDYYYESYPNWVTTWNAERQAEKLAGQQWQLLNDPSSYLLAHQDDRPYEVDLKGYGRVFPHRFGNANSPLLPTQVLVSPEGDRLTLDFAKALIRAEKLGSQPIPDYLAISFSGVDAVNHFFGPSSLENEDMVLQLDRTIANLLVFIADTVGLEKTLIVLAADHGMAEMPEYMMELGVPAGRLYPENIVATANDFARERYAIEKIARLYYRPWLYLDRDKIEAAKLDAQQVIADISQALGEHPGINVAVASSTLTQPQPTPLLQQIQRNYHPDRSGDIYVVQAPYWFNFDKGAVAAMHGSPWRYDTHVPIIFAGSGIQSRSVHRLVHPVDVAPTLASLLGMTAPASARGTVLQEVLEQK